ncbi:MAG TPA: hydrogenase maturation protease [Phycisphaerae bacterium]|nr:hydrogenase maturation protease [Phycisphaerae bacterium]
MVIVGVGNPLARDEGLGPRAIERLARCRLPEAVEVIDAGTDLLAVIGEVAGAERVILIDAVQAGAEPGTIHRFTLDALLAKAGDEPEWRSAHDLTVVGAVRLAEAAGIRLPPTVVFGVEPGEVALGEGLTPAVEAALDGLIETVLAEIGEAG